MRRLGSKEDAANHDLAITSMSLDWNSGEGHQQEQFDAYGFDSDPVRSATTAECGIYLPGAASPETCGYRHAARQSSLLAGFSVRHSPGVTRRYSDRPRLSLRAWVLGWTSSSKPEGMANIAG